MKKFMAMLLATALVFTSAAVILAEEAAVENVPFTGVSVPFIGEGGTILGSHLEFPNNAALTTRMSNMMQDAYLDWIATGQVVTNQDVFTFEVEESPTAARIQFFALNVNLQPTVIYTLYINKANNTVITAAAFAESQEEAVVAPVEEAPEEVEEVEETEVVEEEEEVVTMLPLRVTAEAAGFGVYWFYPGYVDIYYNDEFVVGIMTGSVIAFVREFDEDEDDYVYVEILLDAAPVNVDGTLYVPVTLLTDVLGIEFTPVVTLPAEVVAVADEDEDEVEDEDEEEEEVEDEEEDEEDEEDEE